MAGLTDVARIIEQRLREIEGQLRGYEELARERDRLERARGELVSDDGVRPGRASATRRASRRAAGRGRRARRGANVEAITGFVTAHPGATAAEIATGTGLGRGVVYSATSRLGGSGRLRRVSRGDRQVGYELGGGDAGRSAARELESPEAAGPAPAAVGSRATRGPSAGGENPPVPVGAGRPAAEPARVTATAGGAPKRPATGASAPVGGEPGAKGGRRAAAGRRNAAAGGRAPRGANRAAVLGVIGERPGVSARELATASGVGGGTLYGVLRTLAERGEIEKQELPSGHTGYTLASSRAAAAPSGAWGTPRDPLIAATPAPDARPEGDDHDATPSSSDGSARAEAAAGDGPEGSTDTQ